MAIKKIQIEILAEFDIIHGDRYDYSLVKYKNMHSKVQIICKNHGIFEQQPRAHKSGQGCSKCTISENWVQSRDIDSFIKRAHDVHDNKYDYSKTNYTKTMGIVKIICKTHGEFEQLANSHLNGRGCPQCANNQLKNTDQFIELAMKAHGERYDYSNSNYIDSSNKIIIICRKHGAFTQLPTQHMRGQGCPDCGVESMKHKLQKEETRFLSECGIIHSNKYDYSSVKYNNRTSIIEIGCPNHGVFNQKASEHLRGYGCPKCAGNNISTTNEFIEKAQLIHLNRYNYSNTIYTRSKERIKINCNTHGDFSIMAGYHLQGGGCPSCSLSTQQYQILTFVKTITSDIKSNDRTTISPYELDISIPSHNLAIEFNGNFYHSYNNIITEDRYKHEMKANMAITTGIRLMQINSHEWEKSQDLIKSMISHRLGKSQKIHGRKCEIVCINDLKARTFFLSNHISGHRSAKVSYGLIYNGILASVINFNEIKPDAWEIIRYATLHNTMVIGGLSKLLKKFIIDHKPRSIMTFVDRRYGDGNGYLKAGFSTYGVTRPGYIYLDSNCNPVGSRIKFQKHKLTTILPVFDKDLTEAQNMFNNGYRRMWDAGHLKMKLEL